MQISSKNLPNIGKSFENIVFNILNQKDDEIFYLRDKYGFDNIITSEHPKYRLVGLPFFNSNENVDFEDEFDKILK